MKTTNKLEDDLFDRINGNTQELESAITTWVSSKKDLKSQHNSEIEALEASMFHFLWRCRPYLTTARIAKLVKLSRQALYGKWSKYGYSPDD